MRFVEARHDGHSAIMSYRLPPLTTLRLFEAAARHLSFKQAAAELHVTPSAVSHGIQTLEDWLGVRLFARLNRGLGLTDAGADFLPQVQQALTLLARAAANVPGRKPTGRLSVSAAPSFTSRWLLPRLEEFHALHPDIVVNIDTRHAVLEFPRDGADVGIRLGRGPWDGLHALKLVTDQLIPVCTPGMAASIRCIDDLSRFTRLQVTSVSTEWPSWFEQHGITPPRPPRQLAFDTIHMALDAAAAGMGIALGRIPLIERDLAAGRLTTVLGPPVASDAAYWLVAAPDSLNKPEIAAFRDWLFQAMAGKERP